MNWDALERLYSSLNGKYWSSKSKWMSEFDPCEWTRISCGKAGNPLSLRLVSNNLRGILPSEVGELSTLRLLELDDNEISGSLPTEIGALTSLGQLRVGNNELASGIPTEIGNVLALSAEFMVGFNQMTGSIPSQIGRLSNLEQKFRIEVNSMKGHIPTEVGSLTQMKKFVSLYSNVLTGRIPSEIGQLGELRSMLWVDHNSLTGSIPSELGNLFSFQSSINLSPNELCGTIPTEVQGLGLEDPGLVCPGPAPTAMPTATSAPTASPRPTFNPLEIGGLSKGNTDTILGMPADGTFALVIGLLISLLCCVNLLFRAVRRKHKRKLEQLLRDTELVNILEGGEEDDGLMEEEKFGPSGRRFDSGEIIDVEVLPAEEEKGLRALSPRERDIQGTEHRRMSPRERDIQGTEHRRFEHRRTGHRWMERQDVERRRMEDLRPASLEEKETPWGDLVDPDEEERRQLERWGVDEEQVAPWYQQDPDEEEKARLSTLADGFEPDIGFSSHANREAAGVTDSGWNKTARVTLEPLRSGAPPQLSKDPRNRTQPELVLVRHAAESEGVYQHDRTRPLQPVPRNQASFGFDHPRPTAIRPAPLEPLPRGRGAKYRHSPVNQGPPSSRDPEEPDLLLSEVQAPTYRRRVTSHRIGPRGNADGPRGNATN